MIEGIVARDFTLGVRVPDDGRSRLVIPTAADVAQLLDHADPQLTLCVLLGARGGLRRNELLGLTSDRIDWLSTQPTGTVDRQTAKLRLPQPMSWRPPKTAASVRSVPGPRTLLTAVSRQVEQVGLGEEGVLVHDEGQAWTPNRHGHRWRWLTRRAGLEGIRYHDLRHHYCSTLLSAGVNVVAVSRAAGHASAAVTLDVYGHAMGSDEERIRAALEPAESWLSPESLSS